MEKYTALKQAQDYVRNHWFKISLLILVLIACFKKDLSFSFKVKSDKTPTEDVKNGKQKEEQVKSTESKMTTTENGGVAESTPLSIVGGLFGSDKKKEEFPEIDEASKVAFLKRFASVAIAERKKYGIPSSIILANALRQSYAGKRELTLRSNNHFALPCTFDWNGAGEKLENDCYRRYENAWTSFRDHSVFVTSGKFSDLRRCGETNFKDWAKGLEKLGYPSTGAHLADDLIKIIETYQLERLDKM